MVSPDDVAVLFLLLIIFLIFLGPIILTFYAWKRSDSGDLEYLVSHWWGGLVGMWVYRSYTETKLPDSVRQCPTCSTIHEEQPQFCSTCGEDLGEEDDAQTTNVVQSGERLYCGNCHNQQSDFPTQCHNCGRAVLSSSNID